MLSDERLKEIREQWRIYESLPDGAHEDDLARKDIEARDVADTVPELLAEVERLRSPTHVTNMDKAFWRMTLATQQIEELEQEVERLRELQRAELDAFEAGYGQATTRIVAWLREVRPNEVYSDNHALRWLADAIEQGKHEEGASSATVRENTSGGFGTTTDRGGKLSLNDIEHIDHEEDV